jgi:spoIIIJ-associated protein
MAGRVSHAHEPITLEPMSAYERRIIHLTLREDSLVVTQSIGEGDNRKVVIYPAGWELPPSSS